MDLEKLVAMLRSKDESKRLNALRGLEMCSDKRVPNVLQALASKDPSTRVRYEAKKALSKTMGKASEIGKKANPQEGAERKDAFLDYRVFTRNFASANMERKLKLITAVEKSISKLRQSFAQLLEDEENEKVRAKLALSLGSIGSIDDIPKIAACLRDDDPRVRANAIEGLERIGHPKAYSYITHLLADSDNRIRANVIKALQNYGKRNLETILKEMLSSEHVSMRDSAAYCLAVIATEEHLPLLKLALKDPERSVRSKVRTALERLSQDGIPAAKDLMASFSEETGIFHIESMEDFNDLLDKNLELEDLNHEEASRRMDAIAAISSRNDNSLLPLLLERLKEEQTAIVSIALIDAIKTFGDTSTISTLSRKLRDEDPKVACSAANAMLDMDFDEAAPFVTVALNHPSSQVRGQVFTRLLKADPELALAQLETLCRSTKTLVRSYAVSCFEAASQSEASAVFHERMDSLALEAFRNETEEELFEPLSRAYWKVATAESLSEFFLLLAELEQEVRTPDHNPRRGERPAVSRFKCLNEAKKVVIDKLNLSPEDVGTLSGKAEAQLRGKN